MDLVKHILEDLNYDELYRYICNTDTYKKAMIKYDHEFDEVLNKYLPAMTQETKEKLHEELMKVFSIYLFADEKETFKFAFANGVLIGALSKQISDNSIEDLQKMLG